MWHASEFIYVYATSINNMNIERSEFEQIEHWGQRFELPSDARYQV